MHIENINYFLEPLGESLEMYLDKTRAAFSGKNSDIQFFLHDDTFTWKQQNILIRGEIAVYPLSNILIISDTLRQLLELYQKCQEIILTLEKDNEHANESKSKLTTDIEEMINVKNKMEKDLYAKFLLLLNTKKRKIRDLQKALDSNKQTTVSNSVYDKTTDDESEKSDVESKKVHNTALSKSNKRKADFKSEQKAAPKNNKMNFRKCTNFSSSEETSPEPSTSKNKSTLQNIDVCHTIKQTCNMSEEESEEDLFA